MSSTLPILHPLLRSVSELRNELLILVTKGNEYETLTWLYDHPYINVTECILNEAIFTCLRKNSKSMLDVLLPFTNLQDVKVMGTDSEWMNSYLKMKDFRIDNGCRKRGTKTIISQDGTLHIVVDTKRTSS